MLLLLLSTPQESSLEDDVEDPWQQQIQAIEKAEKEEKARVSRMKRQRLREKRRRQRAKTMAIQLPASSSEESGTPRVQAVQAVHVVSSSRGAARAANDGVDSPVRKAGVVLPQPAPVRSSSSLLGSKASFHTHHSTSSIVGMQQHQRETSPHTPRLRVDTMPGQFATNHLTRSTSVRSLRVSTSAIDLDVMPGVVTPRHASPAHEAGRNSPPAGSSRLHSGSLGSMTPVATHTPSNSSAQRLLAKLRGGGRSTRSDKEKEKQKQKHKEAAAVQEEKQWQEWEAAHSRRRSERTLASPRRRREETHTASSGSSPDAEQQAQPTSERGTSVAQGSGGGGTAAQAAGSSSRRNLFEPNVSLLNGSFSDSDASWSDNDSV